MSVNVFELTNKGCPVSDSTYFEEVEGKLVRYVDGFADIVNHSRISRSNSTIQCIPDSRDKLLKEIGVKKILWSMVRSLVRLYGDTNYIDCLKNPNEIRYDFMFMFSSYSISKPERIEIMNTLINNFKSKYDNGSFGKEEYDTTDEDGTRTIDLHYGPINVKMVIDLTKYEDIGQMSVSFIAGNSDENNPYFDINTFSYTTHLEELT